MKGKIYTLLLAVVAVAMAAGIFASCKDYGEDINNLQDQINKAALKSELTTAQSTLQKAADDAKQAADDAMAEARKRLTESDFEEFANRLEKILRDHQDSLKTAFDKNFEQDEALKDTASNIRRDMSGMQSQLKNDIEGAKTYAEDKVNDLVRDYRLDRDKLLSTVEYNGVRTLLDRSEELLNMVDQIESLDDFNKAAKKVDDFITLVNALTKAVTSVELIGTFTRDGDNNIDYMLANHGQAHDAPFNMAFYKGTQVATYAFGDKEVDKSIATISRLPKQASYTKGDPIRDTVNILVRVSPVDADLSKLQSESIKNILIVNSKGEALDDWLEIGNPKKYGDLLSYTGTRGTNIGSGIWVIPVAMKPNMDITEFMKVTHPDVKLNNSGELISNVPEVLYAVAIRNTAKNVDTRYAISTYDLVSTYENYKPATIFTFKVNDKFVENYYNRWDGTKTVAEETQTNTMREFMWRQKVGDKMIDIATTFNPLTDGALGVLAKKENFGQTIINGDEEIRIGKYGPIFLEGGGTPTTGYYDERRYKPGIDNIITCELGDPIVISSFIGGRPQTTSDGTIVRGNYKETRLDYYYVVIDHIGAIESNESEIVAWKSYSKDIEGINKIYKIGEKCTIKINAQDAAPDIIGFRVYACNLDGTLADPDGRSFYVKVTKASEHGKVVPDDKSGKTVNEIVARAASDPKYYDNSAALNLGTFKVKAPETDWGKMGLIEFSLTNYIKATGGGNMTTAFEADKGGDAIISNLDYPSLLKNPLRLKYWLIKEVDDNGIAKSYAEKWSEVKFIKISAYNIEDWVDGSSLDFTITGYEGQTALGTSTAKTVIDVTIKKAMPTKSEIPYAYSITWPNDMWKPTPGTQIVTLYPTPVNTVDGTYTASADYFRENFAKVDDAIYSHPNMYVWTVEKAGKDNENIVLTSTADDPNDFYYNNIPVSNIGSDKEFTAYIDYNFRGISRPSVSADPTGYKAKAWEGKVKFGNALDLITYTPAEYEYTNNGASVNSTEYFVKWRGSGLEAKIQKYTDGKVHTDVPSQKLESLLGIAPLTKANIYLAGCAGVKGITKGAYTISNPPVISDFLENYTISKVYLEEDADNKAARFLSVDYNSTKEITFIGNNVYIAPMDEVKGCIVVEVKDKINDKTRKLITFPFTLLP